VSLDADDAEFRVSIHMNIPDEFTGAQLVS
jgi:hypothetical protein